MQGRLGTLVTYAVALVLVAFIGFPLLWMVLSSLKPAQSLFVSPPSLLPEGLTLRWYRTVLFDSDAPTLFLNSLIVGGATTALCLTMGTLAAYATTRFQFPGRQLFMLGALASYMFPAIVLFVPIYLTLNALALTDTLAGLVICHTILTYPFAVWMLKAYFEKVPTEIDEAAWIDGASYLRAFWSVVLPLSLPGIFSVGIFIFVLSWNEFLFASIVVTKASTKTLPVGIAEFVTSFDIRWGEIMALGTLATLPVVVLFLFVQRYFLRGVLSGAIKG